MRSNVEQLFCEEKQQGKNHYTSPNQINYFNSGSQTLLNSFHSILKGFSSEGNQCHPILLASHLSFAPCWTNILCPHPLWCWCMGQTIKSVHPCFGSWGVQTIHYFEFIWLVEGPFNAKFNQHGSSVFIECLWPTNVGAVMAESKNPGIWSKGINSMHVCICHGKVK
jgi:hypothetical protein